MLKFYTASTQAKELCEEAKMAREKNKELNKEVLLKKGEVIRLTEDLNQVCFLCHRNSYYEGK